MIAMKKISVLIKKEIMEILRDKKTLIIMVVVPMLLYPAIIIVMTVGMSVIMQAQEEKTYTIGYLEQDQNYVAPLEEVYEKNQQELEYILDFHGASKNDEETARAEADLWLSFSEENDGVHIRADYSSTDQDSSYAEIAFNELADLYSKKLLAENLAAEGLSEDFLHPVTYEALDSATMSETVGMSMGGAIGMLLITMILMGAFYPAVDITTGEKERGTLETLLTLPVSNFQMIMSKYIAVSLFACATAVISLISLSGVVFFMMSGVINQLTDEMGKISFGGYLGCIPVLLAAMITTAMLITALCMCFCIFAKSTKEANNYITPVMLVVMFASMVGMIPSVELDYKLALVPLVNVSLLIKQVLSQQMDLALAGITILVNMAYGVIIVWILAKMYDSEDILFSDGFRSFRIFQKRSDIKKGTVPATGDLIICMVVILLAMIYVGGMISLYDVFAGTVFSQILILVVPVLVTWYMKSDCTALFHIRRPKLKAVAGSIIFYIGMFSFVLVASVILSQFLTESTQNVAVAFEEIMEQPFALVVLVVAVMPAVGEELLFRGLLLGSLGTKYKTGLAIVLSSVVFGLFHMSLVKLIPTALLGICLAVVVTKGGSIFLSMLLHFTNNLLSVLSMKYPEKMGELFPILMKESLSTAEICLLAAVAAVCTAVGYLILRNSNNKVSTAFKN